MAACLDEEPKDQLTEDEAFANASSLYINTVATLYNYLGGNADSQGLQGTYRGVYDYCTFTTDEAMLPTRGGDWYDGGFWQSLYRHEWTADDGALYDTWNYLYKVVVLCNRSLARLDSHASLLAASTLAAYKAEVRAIRALFYYYLMDLYGRVPLVVSDEVPIHEVRQSSRSEIFRFVVSELQETAPLLADVRSNEEGPYYGRVTRLVAWFLLAKLSLNAAVYTDDDWTDGVPVDGRRVSLTVGGTSMNAYEAAIAYCDLLAEGGYELSEDYADNFSVHNENSPENIFTIPMDKLQFSNMFLYLFRSRHYNHGSALGMDAENGACATLHAVRTFGYGTSEVDSRYAVCFFSDTVHVDGSVVTLDNGQPLVYRPLDVQLDLTGTPYEKTAGARMAKYEIDRTAHADGKLQSNDIVLFRYADVLLMKGEALFRNGADGAAFVNAVRTRAGMAPLAIDGSNWRTLLLDERLRELMWEGWRRQDMVRFGCFHQAYDQRQPLADEGSGYTTVFPIPQTVIDLNHNLTQNGGYK